MYSSEYVEHPQNKRSGPPETGRNFKRMNMDDSLEDWKEGSDEFVRAMRWVGYLGVEADVEGVNKAVKAIKPGWCCYGVTTKHNGRVDCISVRREQIHRGVSHDFKKAFIDRNKLYRTEDVK